MCCKEWIMKNFISSYKIIIVKHTKLEQCPLPCQQVKYNKIGKNRSHETTFNINWKIWSQKFWEKIIIYVRMILYQVLVSGCQIVLCYLLSMSAASRGVGELLWTRQPQQLLAFIFIFPYSLFCFDCFKRMNDLHNV